MRVIIAEDEVLLREGISRILTEEDYDVVGLAGDRDELLGKVRAHRPDLVVTDIRMPPTHTDEGLTAALQIRQIPEIAIIVLSQHVDPAGAVELLSLGAAGIGYLLKRRVMDLDDFLESVGRVAAGGSSIDPEVISSMVQREVRDNRDHGVAQLTPRRLEVLQLMARATAMPASHAELFVTEKAVARSIALIFQTLGLPPDPDDHRRVIAVMRARVVLHRGVPRDDHALGLHHHPGPVVPHRLPGEPGLRPGRIVPKGLEILEPDAIGVTILEVRSTLVTDGVTRRTTPSPGPRLTAGPRRPPTGTRSPARNSSSDSTTRRT